MFQRYVKEKMVIDLFIGMPNKNMKVQRDGKEWTVVEPEHLLSLYKTIHGSRGCIAVVTASKLLEKGLKSSDLVDHPDLVKLPTN
jgi:hypothetical protein